MVTYLEQIMIIFVYDGHGDPKKYWFLCKTIRVDLLVNDDIWWLVYFSASLRDQASHEFINLNQGICGCSKG
jgi:hypothetical protein